MDAFEYQVRALVAREQLEELGFQAEAKLSLDPMLLDRLRDALAEYCQDPEDQEAHERYVCAFADFLEAVVDNLPDKR